MSTALKKPRGMPFAKGNKIAPGQGSVATPADLKVKCRNLTHEVIERWADIVRNGSNADAIRAGDLILTRAWGHPRPAEPDVDGSSITGGLWTLQIVSNPTSVASSGSGSLASNESSMPSSTEGSSDAQ